jgi:hypothetical protein
MFRVSVVGIALLATMFRTEPHLAFRMPGPVQPVYVDGEPSWRDTLEVRHGSIVARQLTWRDFDHGLVASLQTSDRLLSVRLITGPSTTGAMSFKGAKALTAYEARISGLRAGAYRLEVWRARTTMSDTLLLRRAVNVP